MQLTTQRLILRDFLPRDWPAVLSYQRDPRYLRIYPWETRTEADARAFVAMFVNEQSEEPRRRFQLAVTMRENERLIGACGIRRKPGNDWEADMGYELAPDFWGIGYATEAARAIINFGFVNLGLHRISSRCISENIPSVRVLERLGFRLEGRLRRKEHFKGRWWDTLLFALLVDEWRNLTLYQGESSPLANLPP